MFKKASKRFVLVVLGVLALAAFVMPSMVSAASWETTGSSHTLTSSDLRFINGDGTLGSICAATTLQSTVTSTAVLSVTAGTFTNCMGTGAMGTPCTTTPVGKFPWQATGISTTDI